MTAFRAETIGGLSLALAEAAKAANALVSAGIAAVIEVKESSRGRTSPQNRKMWAMLRDVSKQVEWYGQWLSDDEWKDMITAMLKGQKCAPGINGGVVFFGQRTSKMSVKEEAEVIEALYWFGAEHDVKWAEPEAARA